MTALLKISLDGAVLTHFSGSEAVSEVFSYQLKFWMRDGLMPPESFLDKRVLVQVQLEKINNTHGCLVSVQQEYSDDRGVYFRAEMVPWFWYLKTQVTSRIFKNANWMQIFKEVCHELGFYEFDFSLLKKSYGAHQYKVQYQESSFDFLSRLLQEERVFYYFRHEMNNHVLCFFDTTLYLNIYEGGILDLKQGYFLQDSFHQGNSQDYLTVGLKVNQNRWLTQVVHESHDFSSLPFAQISEGVQAYHNQFQALDLNLFPRRLFSLALMNGVERAHVLAATNVKVEVKALFSWSYCSTPQIRVAQAQAGETCVQQFLPRLQDEVFIEYSYGNPEQPQVLRSLAFGCTPNALASPAHFILWGDSAFHIHTEGDYQVSVSNNEFIFVGESLCESTSGSAYMNVLGSVSMVASERMMIKAGAGYLMISPSVIEVHGELSSRSAFG